MKSMTGYAWQESVCDDKTISVEIKSYNSRFLDLSVNVPYWLSRLENRIRERVSASISRGKVELNLRIREKNASLQVVADVEAARSYIGAIAEVAQTLGHTDRIPLSLIIAQDGVLRAERTQDPDTWWVLLEPLLDAALAEHQKTRLTEGIALKKDILAMLDRIIQTADIVTAELPGLERTFKENLRTRFQEVLGNQVDEQRILTETAALLVKYTVNEELVRLRAHIDALKHELEHNPAPGRKIDFICQEMNREINTIGSKNQNLVVGQAVIEAKDALENIREQMRNIE